MLISDIPALHLHTKVNGFWVQHVVHGTQRALALKYLEAAVISSTHDSPLISSSSHPPPQKVYASNQLEKCHQICLTAMYVAPGGSVRTLNNLSDECMQSACAMYHE